MQRTVNVKNSMKTVNKMLKRFGQTQRNVDLVWIGV